MTTELKFRVTRLGPVYLDWSEDPDSGARVIGWGGDDMWKCDAHPDWEGDADSGPLHAQDHGYADAPRTSNA